MVPRVVVKRGCELSHRLLGYVDENDGGCFLGVVGCSFGSFSPLSRALPKRAPAILQLLESHALSKGRGARSTPFQGRPVDRAGTQFESMRSPTSSF